MMMGDGPRDTNSTGWMPKAACALSLLVALAAAPVAARTSAPPPSVFLITIDTLRADHVHCYGFEQVRTPAIDALSRDGIRFAHAFTVSPITNTSHASILTGVLPAGHGVR